MLGDAQPRAGLTDRALVLVEEGNRHPRRGPEAPLAFLALGEEPRVGLR